MSWYDYVPILGTGINLVEHPSGTNALKFGADLGTGGGYTAAMDIYAGGKGLYDKYKGAVNEQKQGDLTAASEAATMGNNLYTEALGGLDKAEGYYAPARKMLTNAYGDPGAMTGGPAQYPVK